MRRSPRLHDGALRGQAGRDTRCRRLLARDRATTGRGSLHRATAFRAIRQRGPRGRAHRRTTSTASARSSSPASAATPRRSLGRAEAGRPRRSTTGGRPRPAGRSPRTVSASSRCPVEPGSPTRAARVGSPGARDDGSRAAGGRDGRALVKLPMPPGASPTLWNADERFRETYLDSVSGLLPDRRRRVHRRPRLRVRDGPHRRRHQCRRHRLSTGAIEEVLAAHPDVAECAVIGVA